MNPLVSIIMGSTSDLPVMEKAAKFFEEMEIPFEMNALSAHRTPDAVEAFAKDAQGRIIAAGMGAWIGLQSFLNIGVAIGILPNTGIPLPFVSYGLTSLVCLYAGIGFTLNVRMQQ